MILAEMDPIVNPLSVLVDTDALGAHDKSESDPSSAFIDYNGWMTNDFNIDAETVLSPCKTMSSPSDQPQILQWTPHEGNSNTNLSIILEQPPCDKPRGPLKIAFGQMPLDTSYNVHSVPTMEENDPAITTLTNSFTTTWVTLTAKVPDVHSIQLGPDCQTSVFLYFYDHDDHNLIVDSWSIGSFTYQDSPLYPSVHKRTLSPSPAEGYSKKRTHANTLDNAASSVDCQLLQLLAPYEDPLGQQDQNYSAFTNITTQNDRDTALWIAQQLQQRPSQQQQVSQGFNQSQQSSLQASQCQRQARFVGGMDSVNARYMDGLTMRMNNSVSPQRAQPSQADRYGGILYDGFSNADASSKNYSPNTPMKPTTDNSYNYQSDGTNYNNATTTVQTQVFNNGYSPTNGNNAAPQNICGSTSSSNTYSVSSIHPFAGILNKANLKICGDLMEMTFQWSANEWQSGRRLVRFWRRQNTSNVENTQQVECGFEPIEYYVHQQEQQRHHHNNGTSPISPTNKVSTTTSLVVSCIYWRERNDYFITSVDCIYLLEGLIGVQFTVEEKNRIRRNLEGFRPLTVSKCKADCADFFKLIMGFPHPKPRNIEKDVKVFAWKTLPHALRKIIRKYKPNYSNPYQQQQQPYFSPVAVGQQQQQQQQQQQNLMQRQYCY